MNKSTFLIFLSLCIFPFSCETDKSGNQNTVLKLNWIYTGSFAPEALAANDDKNEKGIKIRLEPGGQGKDPLKLVGNNEFGIAAADEILRANDKGGDFVIIGVVNHDSPACFLALEKDSISTPKDFEGKKIGILPFGSTGLIYKILLKKNGVDESKISELTVYPDLKIFTSGNHNVQPAFIYDEPITLQNDGFKFSIIEPKDYGVSFRGPCYFTTRKTIEDNPNLVQSFIDAMIESIYLAIKKPQVAISALKKIDQTINEKRELSVWNAGIPYFTGFNNKPLSTKLDQWDEMLNEMVEFEELSSKPDITKVVNTSFVENYYNKNGSN